MNSLAMKVNYAGVFLSSLPLFLLAFALRISYLTDFKSQFGFLLTVLALALSLERAYHSYLNEKKPLLIFSILLSIISALSSLFYNFGMNY